MTQINTLDNTAVLCFRIKKEMKKYRSFQLFSNSLNIHLKIESQMRVHHGTKRKLSKIPFPLLLRIQDWARYCKVFAQK